MDFFSIIKLFGGVSLFLYGMGVMGQGLEKLSGGKLEKILEKFTNTTLKGVALGAVVTGAIQSSAATTVMLIGFVNSGIMNLSQAIGVIMGANIGTTATAWLLSLAGISSSNFFLQLLKPANFSLIFAIVGIILYMFIKKKKNIEIGQILLGFAILIFGMTYMTESVQKYQELLGKLFSLFSNPFFGVLAGTVVTALIQSSSASVGILQAVSISSNMTFSVAFPIILGQNIGTCVTALLSSIDTNKNAKRVAMVHLYFNLIGTVLFFIVAYSLKALLDLPIWDMKVTPAGIATIHSAFNITCTMVFLPFTRLFEKLAVFTIKDKGEPTDMETIGQMLDERFLHSPAFALTQCKNTIITMAELAKINIIMSLDLFKKYDENVKTKIYENEEIIDVLEDKIGSYLVKITDRESTPAESKLVSNYLYTINDIERIGDHAENITEIAMNMHAEGSVFSSEAKKELDVMKTAVMDIIERGIEVFKSNNEQEALYVEPLEDTVNAIRDSLKKRHVNRLKAGQCTNELGVWFNDLLTNLERVSDHCSNIAIYVIEFHNENLKAHEYTHNPKNIDKAGYEEKYDAFMKKYHDQI